MLALTLACGKPGGPPPAGGSTQADAGTLPPLGLPAGCQPLLAGADCFLPYPSDFFRVADAGSPTGYAIETTGAAKLRLPLDAGSSDPGASADITDFRPLDGFSTIPAVVALFPEAVTPAGFPGIFDDFDGGVPPSSAMLLVEADTGTPVPSFVDLDPRATNPARQAIVLHPLVALKYTTRYVVALHGVQAAAGGLAPAPEGFRRLRDGKTVGDPQLAPLQAHYDTDVFPVIAKLGVARGDLQLAWDFTTGDETQADADMLQVRKLTMEWLAQNTPAVQVTKMDVDPQPNSWRQIQGTVEGPLFLTSGQPGATLYRGSDGQVAQNGTTRFPFTANVPASVRDGSNPGRTVAYGHGFFGSQSEVIDGSTREIAQALQAVFFCIDWWGMSTADAPVLINSILYDPSQILLFGERVPQAMANWIVMTAAIRGPLHAESHFLRPASGEGSGQGAGANDPVYDGQPANYLGISQGAILGTVLNSLSPDFRQIDLNVGGAAFTQMMWRAVPFNSFLDFIRLADPDPLEQQKWMASTQAEFDRFDPATYAPLILQRPPAGSPPRSVLMQNGLGDAEVPNMASFLLARLIGIPELSPNDYPVPLLPEQPAPVASAMTLWDFGVDLAALYGQAEPQATNSTPVHEGVRLQPSALAQMDAFFRPGGEVIDPCDGGPCYAVDAGLGYLPGQTPPGAADGGN